MVNAWRIVTAAFLAAVSVGLGACAVPYDYRNIQPTWAVNNSPIPVPQPVAKPVIQAQIARVSSASTRSLWTPAKAATSRSVVRVAPGESVYGLARRHRVSPSQIIALNKLYAPYHLKDGMMLRLRADKEAAPVRVVKTLSRSTSSADYTVKRGDTLYGIARKLSVSPSALASSNGLKQPYQLRPGQSLSVPSSQVAAPRVQQASAAPQRQSPQTGAATFIWPASGKVVSGFGVKANGLRNDGINIAANVGAPVYAAASGEVLYAGSQLRAYGNLILIQHKNGLISTYGHNDSLMVVPGQVVEQGQQIATVGKTGNVAVPQLHFELRRNADAVDPMRYLGRVRMAVNSR